MERIAVEPIKHTLTARLHSLKMYRPELDQLVALFQSTCESVVISDKTHIYKSLDEMKANVGLRIKEIDIRGEKPGVHFLLNQKEFAPGSSTPAIFNELRTEEIAEDAEALFFKVEHFLIKQQRPSVTRFLIPSLLGIFGVALLTTRGVALAISQGQPFREVSGIIVCFAISIVSLVFGIANSRNYLILDTKLNSPSFVVRNREEFAKYVVIALISGAVSFFFGWLLGHLSK